VDERYRRIIIVPYTDFIMDLARVTILLQFMIRNFIIIPIIIIIMVIKKAKVHKKGQLHRRKRFLITSIDGCIITVE
jgi:hypothetical protein